MGRAYNSQRYMQVSIFFHFKWRWLDFNPGTIKTWTFSFFPKQNTSKHCIPSPRPHAQQNPDWISVDNKSFTSTRHCVRPAENQNTTKQFDETPTRWTAHTPRIKLIGFKRVRYNLRVTQVINEARHFSGPQRCRHLKTPLMLSMSHTGFSGFQRADMRGHI